MAGLTELDGRTAIVTGAAGGIGLAISEAFVAAGIRVVMTDSNSRALRRTLNVSPTAGLKSSRSLSMSPIPTRINAQPSVAVSDSESCMSQ